MKINNLKINGFGNLENKEINLGSGFNLILGDNENGKSTLVKFIQSMLFGIPKNKIEKYKPWYANEFSGKMNYILDNRERYSIYRNFENKETQILNINDEDVTYNYGIDKAKGSLFFYEQTNVDEHFFKSTILVEQNQSKLDKTTQNQLVEKVTNLVSTGSDNISYEKAMDKLNKKLVEEVGTDRSNGRPINILDSNIKELQKEKQDLINSVEEYNKIKKEYAQLENELRVSKQNNIEIEKKHIENEKIKANKKMKENYKEQLKNTQKNIEEKNDELDSLAINKIKYIIFTILFFICLGISYFYEFVPIGIFVIVFFIILIIDLIKKNKNKNKIIFDIEKLEMQESNLIDNIKNIDKIIKLIEEELQKQEQEKIVNDIMIKLNTLEINKKNIEKKIEQLNICQTTIDNLFEDRKKLESLAKSISITKEVLEISYKKAKENITPNLKNHLEKCANKISSGAYNKVYFKEDGLSVELKNGRIIPIELLSGGTIDQMYLSLRLNMINDIITENMPIILDEPFAFYDDNRLENTLLYFDEEFQDKQKIIFSCSNREYDILNGLGLRFNIISL